MAQEKKPNELLTPDQLAFIADQVASRIHDPQQALPAWKALATPEVSQLPTDPFEFFQKALGIKTLTQEQTTITQTLVSNRFVAVESGHSVGKTFLAALIVAWWISTKQPAIAITTAPTWHQVSNLLWRQLRTLHRNAPLQLPGRMLETPRWEVNADHYAIGLSPRKATEQDVASIQGYHSPNLLVVLDEAAGLPRPLWQAAESLVTGENDRFLAVGNPIGQEGPFWEAVTSNRFTSLRISCLNHPNVIQNKDVIPGAVSKTWILERIADWTTPSQPDAPNAFQFENNWYLPLPVFESRVLGRAPQEREDQLIRLAWIERAQIMWHQTDGKGDKVLSVDPARFGASQSVAILRHGDRMEWTSRRQGIDVRGVIGWVARLYTDSAANTVRVDEIGIGAGVVDGLRGLGIPVEGINVSRPATAKRRFVNLRTEAWWTVRGLLAEGTLLLPADDLLSGDLTAVRYGFDSLGRLELESKEATSGRLGRSPDTGDALMISYAGQARSVRIQDRDRAEAEMLLDGGSRWRRSQGSWTVGMPRRGKRGGGNSRWRVSSRGR